MEKRQPVIERLTAKESLIYGGTDSQREIGRRRETNLIEKLRVKERHTNKERLTGKK